MIDPGEKALHELMDMLFTFLALDSILTAGPLRRSALGLDDTVLSNIWRAGLLL